jgi:hypothetical protein
MSKPNSRFAILLEDTDLNANNNNNFRDNNKLRDNIENDILKNEDNVFKSHRSRERKQEHEKPELEQKKLEKEKLEQKKLENNKKEEEKLEKDLSLDNFPELLVQEADSNNDATYISFLDKLKIEKTEKEEELDIDNELENLEPGWQIIKRDLETGEIIVKSKSIFKQYEHKSDTQLAYAIVKGLSFLHEKRTNEYIDKWGYNEWENMFRFQNYDYEYFDKLDELYEEELDAENENEYNDFNVDNIEYNGDFDITLNYE